MNSGRIQIPKTDVPCILLLSLPSASCTCQSSGDGTAAARHPPTTLSWRLTGQHAGAASIRPEPTRRSDILQGKLFSMSEASRRTGGLSVFQISVLCSTYIYIFLHMFPRAGGDGSRESVAPRALCVLWVWDRVGQSQLLREGRPAVLRVGLLHPLLSALCALQQAHTKRETLGCARLRLCLELILTWAPINSVSLHEASYLFIPIVV